MTTQPNDVPIQYTARGTVPRGAAAYALRRIEQVLAKVSARVLHVHVTLTYEPNPALEHPARAEVSVDVNGTPVRARVDATELQEAADLVVDRLQRQLIQLRARTRTRHRWLAVATEHEWRHGGAPEPPRPVSGDRPVIRRKTFALEPLTPDEAAYEMDLLDHNFYLFTGTDGADALTYRTDDDGYAVLGPTGVPVLTLAEARERLRAGHEPFVFYRDPDRRRGHVLYVRHDSRLGLILPSSTSTTLPGRGW
ncbi:ribosome hibernation promotion factor [Kribbella sindirgiensis]|uniref:HPF/RaiA family ribosome-associated protein n=1 Tax=Kribbella sindirgiensis TaxID=1124744 RepID=A0A4R0I3G9_9ACTN|nr:HPF/RaiA family ribosome-associated protein [Kribbella sindirgiensis]TCC20569.1 HPF/RaiA family ribosome-associated protein [Kribbella sindirgiensis]